MILAFGYWGTYKRLELLLESMNEIGNKAPDAVLAIAGMNHPSTPGYLESLAEQYRGNPRIRFLGYVPEEELPGLFRSAGVLVLPYTSAAGTSGVVHQACEYGLPMVATDIPEMRELAREEGIAIDFYARGDGAALTNHLVALLGSSDMRRRASEHNSSVAQGMQMSSVVNEYLRLFEVRLKRPGELGKCPQSSFLR
jgi:glycosyltransferase involved in cell wall biosynthesis